MHVEGRPYLVYMNNLWDGKLGDQTGTHWSVSESPHDRYRDGACPCTFYQRFRCFIRTPDASSHTQCLCRGV